MTVYLIDRHLSFYQGITISAIQALLTQVAEDVLRTFQVNWPFLLLSVVLASAIQVYVGTDRLASWLRARTRLAVVGAVVLAVITPFCSCSARWPPRCLGHRWWRSWSRRP